MKRTAQTENATPKVRGKVHTCRREMSHANVSPLFYHGKVRFALRLADMVKLSDKVKHWKVSTEETELSAGDVKKSPSNVVHVFWDEVELFTTGAPAEAEVHLTSVEQVGLTSGVKAGMEMHLWSYHQVVNAPSGVFLRRAADVLSLDVARKFVETGKHSLRKVADFVRVLAVQNYPGQTRSQVCGHMLRECELEDFERNPVQQLIFVSEFDFD